MYTREYPESYEEAISLINSLIDMYNELDNSFIEYRKVVIDEQTVLNRKLDVLKLNNESYRKLTTVINKEIQEVTHYLNSLRSNIAIHATFGPVYNFAENVFGSAIGIGFSKNLNLLNLHGGLNINTTIYYPMERNIPPDFGVSLYLSMFLN
jgi:phage-related tail protein